MNRVDRASGRVFTVHHCLGGQRFAVRVSNPPLRPLRGLGSPALRLALDHAHPPTGHRHPPASVPVPWNTAHGVRVPKQACFFPTICWNTRHRDMALLPGALRGQRPVRRPTSSSCAAPFAARCHACCCFPTLRLLHGPCRSSEWPVPLGTPAAGAATAERCSYFALRCTIVTAAWHVCPIRCAALIRLVAYPVEACAELRIRRAAACRTRRLRRCAADPSHASIGRSTDARSSRSIVGHVRRPTAQSTGLLPAAPTARACTPVHFGVSCAVQHSPALPSIADDRCSRPSVPPLN